MSKLEDNYRSYWEKKTSSQIKQEIKSWQIYFNKRNIKWKIKKYGN